MPSYLQIEHISKSYGTKVLFEDISFHVNEGDKIALIAPNGTGKTSLLRILAGKDASDSGGKILFLKDIRIAFLEQEYVFDPEATVWDQVLSDSRGWMEPLDPEHRSAYAFRIRKYLSTFRLEPSRRMKALSGGEATRVALVGLLSCEPDFYILDEPTNHLDIDAIELLESELRHSRRTILMVTHDRYFLDGVANIVMELDHGAVYVYRGDYQNYLQKRQERIGQYNAETDKVRNLLRRELEWMHASPCARSGKAKARKNAFYSLKERAEQVYAARQVRLDEMGGGNVRMGTKVIDCRDLTFHYGGECYLDHFTYKFQRYERVGVVGANGVGKTTFLNLLLGEMDPDDPGVLSGQVERGASLRVGYYRQSGMDFKGDQTVLETVTDTHLLGQFLFPHEMFSTRVSELSGGEKRRLYLLTVLMRQPNFLVMDEPTNDLDIVTLNVLEEYLADFRGTLVIVSHDRHFLDRLVDHLFILSPGGKVKDFVGSYSQWRDETLAREAALRKAARTEASRVGADRSAPARADAGRDDVPRKLSYKEAHELSALEAEIAALGAEKQALEALLSGGTQDYVRLQEATARFAEVSRLLDEKETRWLELSL